tara:strand:- start:3513 stop:3749 length:237 start_codon:yes stop_codon:yes gene_type:complete
MNKYYVQSGDLKYVISANSDREACFALLKKHMSPDLMISESFVVSQRGYPLDRQPFVMDTTEAIFSSQEICHELNNRS